MPVSVDSPSASTSRRRAAQARHLRSLGVLIEGPLFTADIGKTIGANVHAFVVELARVGEAEARSRIASAPKKRAGPSWSGIHVRGRTKALGGRGWAVSAVVSADTTGLSAAEAVRVQAILAGRHNAITRDGQNQGTTRGYEGTARVFSGTASLLRSIIRNPDLTKGL